MDNKRCFVYFVLIFAFIIFSINLISSAPSCSIKTSCNNDKTIMKLSSTTNAHGELYNGVNYDYKLCCEGLSSIHPDCKIYGSNTILKLSSTTNAHAESNEYFNYGNPVCFGNLRCDIYPYLCSNPDYPIGLLSLSDITNAHLGAFSEYDYKICCNDTTSPTHYCGNSIPELGAGEQCDCGMDGSCTFTELDRNTCKSVKGEDHWYGDLGCTAPPTGCLFDTSQCYYCGNGVIEGTEQCDDGNHYSNDGCSVTCKKEVCGDGVTQTGLGEQCDDGNTVNGDCCSSTCAVDPGCTCTT